MRIASVLAVATLVLWQMMPAMLVAEDTPPITPVVEEVSLTEEPTVEEADTAEVVTGEASAEADVENEVNVDIIDTSAEVISASSTAEVLNTSTTTAETGENIATSTEEVAQISTGNAYASVNVASVVNLNLVNSNGFLYLLNNFLSPIGSLDLRPLTSVNPQTPTNPCGQTGCDATSTSLLDISNNAEITNSVVVRSSTGENSAEGSDASIQTGDAYAGANLVNIANTNIVDSEYLLFAFNNFGGWDGDLILPNSDFFASFFNQPTGSNSSIEANNSATVTNNVSVVADTGGNVASGGDSSIETGNAVAGTNVENLVNTNILNSSTFFVVFRIFGSWNGDVFNAPEGVSWQEGDSGIELFGNSGGSGETGGIDISASSTANVVNNVQVMALTGENMATSTGNALISTGNAYAGANVLNIANTNIISSNWIVALINIFGDWGGNVSFGQPDLWVATQAEAPDPLTIGSEVTFHTTIVNRGDATASDVVFSGEFNPEVVNIYGAETPGTYTKRFNRLRAGEIEEFSYTLRVVDMNPFYTNELIAHDFSVSEHESDANLADNGDSISLLAVRPPGYLFPHGNDQRNTIASTYPDLVVAKLGSASTTEASSTVSYTIEVKNEGGASYNSVLYDVLEDEHGNVITENSWDLGEIRQFENISITYDTVFNASTTPGFYTNYAWIEASGKDYKDGRLIMPKADSNTASSTIEILGEKEEEQATSTQVEVIKTDVVRDIEEILSLLDAVPALIIRESDTDRNRYTTGFELADGSEIRKLDENSMKNEAEKWQWSVVLSLLVFTGINPKMKSNKRRKVIAMF